MKRCFVALTVLVCASLASAGDATVPGESIVDPPTLRSLGFEWLVEGDDNRNGSVAVAYRKRGEQEWRQAQPLLRIHGENVYLRQPPRNRLNDVREKLGYEVYGLTVDYDIFRDAAGTMSETRWP